jgi:hypothetical protein
LYINSEIKTSKEISILLNIEYSDDNYKTYQTQEEVKFNVYTKNDAQKIGLIKRSSFGKTSILFLILAFFTYRWIRKRKR